jgi:hypothetical protein
MSEKDIKRRQAYLDGYVDGRAGRSYARDYGKVIANTMDAVDRAYHTGYTAGKYARQAEKERDDDEMPQLPEHSNRSYPIRIPGRGNRSDIKAGRSWSWAVKPTLLGRRRRLPAYSWSCRHRLSRRPLCCTLRLQRGMLLSRAWWASLGGISAA